MEHITIIELSNGRVKLVPDENYRVRKIGTLRTYSYAIIPSEDTPLWEAICDES